MNKGMFTWKEGSTSAVGLDAAGPTAGGYKCARNLPASSLETSVGSSGFQPLHGWRTFPRRPTQMLPDLRATVCEPWTRKPLTSAPALACSRRLCAPEHFAWHQIILTCLDLFPLWNKAPEFLRILWHSWMKPRILTIIWGVIEWTRTCVFGTSDVKIETLRSILVFFKSGPQKNNFF